MNVEIQQRGRPIASGALSPKARRSPWDVLLVGLVVVGLASVMLTDAWIHSRRAEEVKGLWREAESRGYAVRFYTSDDDRTPKYRFKEANE